jgi:hypothetical protein
MRVCKKCGEQRDGVKRCSNCNRIYKKEHQKKYRLENPEKVKEIQRKYRLANPEKEKERLRKWRLENREKEKEYRLENAEKYKERQIKHRLKKQIGETPPPELVEVKLLINKTKQLCKTLKN